MSRRAAPSQAIPPPARRYDAETVAHQRCIVAQAARIHAEEIWQAEGRRRPCACQVCEADRGDARAFALVIADALRRRNVRMGWA